MKELKDIIKNFDVREFVPKEVYDMFKERSWQFVSDNVVKMALGIEELFNEICKAEDSKVEKITVLINNWHLGGPFSNRGLRTVSYINSQIAKGIKTAMLSQHVGGSTNAIDFNIIIHYKDGSKVLMSSDKTHDTITSNEKRFMEIGLTTLEDKSITVGWTHGDCRYTGMETVYIVKP